MTILRAPTDDDIRAAMRGLGMMRLTDAGLVALRDRHEGQEVFASQVISTAAKRILTTRDEDKTR